MPFVVHWQGLLTEQKVHCMHIALAMVHDKTDGIEVLVQMTILRGFLQEKSIQQFFCVQFTYSLPAGKTLRDLIIQLASRASTQLRGLQISSPVLENEQWPVTLQQEAEGQDGWEGEAGGTGDVTLKSSHQKLGGGRGWVLLRHCLTRSIQCCASLRDSTILSRHLSRGSKICESSTCTFTFSTMYMFPVGCSGPELVWGKPTLFTSLPPSSFV